LYCLAAGHADDAARRGLDQTAIARLLDQARRQFDYVVVDTCSIAEAADPLCLAQRVDAAVVSLRTFRSRVPAADEIMRQLAALGTPVLGVVLTDPTLSAGEV
jgi:Mrp family chromosome partitioning ATPase